MPDADFGPAPPQPEADWFNLPQLVSDYMGVAISVARMEIALGEVYIDGHKSEQKFDFKRSQLAGKIVRIVGGRRNFQFLVPSE